VEATQVTEAYDWRGRTVIGGDAERFVVRRTEAPTSSPSKATTSKPPNCKTARTEAMRGEQTRAFSLSEPGQVENAFRVHHRKVHAAALSVLRDPTKAEDVVQDVFLRVWRNPDRFDPARGELGAYLRLMARHRAMDLLREAKVRKRAVDCLERAAERQEAPTDSLPEAALDRHQNADTLRVALRRLPPPQREALLLAYWGGLTTDQVATHTNTPLGTAKSRIRLGRDKLRHECDTALQSAV
jgi:RNA polymerase sigma-70 factor (ECF subfamily)